MQSKIIYKVPLLSAVLFLGAFGLAQQSSQNPTAPPAAPAIPAQQVPVIDGGLGPCSAEITVKRPGGKIVEGAKVSVHIAYGFLSVRRLDLEVPTNNQGRVRFTGLPNNLKHGLLFHGEKDNLLGTAFVDPSRTCEAKHELVLVQRAPVEQDTQSPDSAKSDTGKNETDKSDTSDTDKTDADKPQTEKKDNPQE